MQITIDLPQELSDKLLAILKARKSKQTAEELATELLEDSIYASYIRHVDGYKS